MFKWKLTQQQNHFRVQLRTGSTSLVSTASSIADELADRDRRRNNIILYNFSEKSDREADRKAFNDMCQVVFSEQFAVSKVIRLGKRSEDKDRHRPLLVGLNQEYHFL